MSLPPPPPPLPPTSLLSSAASNHPPPPPPPLPPSLSRNNFPSIQQPSTPSPAHSDVSLDSDDAKQHQTPDAHIPSSSAPPSSPTGTSLSGDDNDLSPVARLRTPAHSTFHIDDSQQSGNDHVMTWGVLATEGEEGDEKKGDGTGVLEEGVNGSRVVCVVGGKEGKEGKGEVVEELGQSRGGGGSGGGGAHVKVGYVEELPDEEEVERRKNVEREVATLLEGKRQGRCYSDWGVVADDALSLEELQLEADEVTRVLEGLEGKGLVRATPFERGGSGAGSGGGKHGGGKCGRVEGLRKRARDVVEALADVQMITAGSAADAEIRLGSELGLRGEVAKLKITLDHLARLILEQAQLIMDRVEESHG